MEDITVHVYHSPQASKSNQHPPNCRKAHLAGSFRALSLRTAERELKKKGWKPYQNLSWTKGCLLAIITYRTTDELPLSKLP